MKYKTKIFLFFLGITTVSVFGSVVILYFESKQLVFSLISDQLVSTTGNIPLFIDKKLINSVIEKQGKDEQQYRKLKRLLVNAVEMSQKTTSLVPFRNIFIATASDKPYTYRLIADGYSNSSISASYGQQFPTPFNLLIPIEAPTVSFSVQNSPQGSWYSGIGPIFDDSGALIAYLCAEIDVAVFTSAYSQSLLLLIASGFSTLIVGFFLAAVLAHIVTDSLEVIEKGIRLIKKGELETKIELETEDEFGVLAAMINEMVTGLHEKERLKVGFSRYVSDYVLRNVISDENGVLSGQRKKITVLFSDIRHFTSLAETLPAEEIVKLLNCYFEQMINVIFAHKGTLDKFIGDGMMVVFGAPLDDNQQEVHAVKAAIEMQRKLLELNREFLSEGKPQLEIGIGIHSGLAIVGNIGSEKRMEYTAIGDTVNTAARIEQLTKTYSQPIIVSESVYQAVQSQFSFQDLGIASVKGKKQDIQIYSLDLTKLH